MKPCLSVLFAGVIASTIATTAGALPAGSAPDKGPVYPMDCAKAKDKARCENLNRDIKACKDKLGDDWRECMRQPAPTTKFTPPKLRDCSAARNQEVCEKHNSALDACKDQGTRAAHRKCMAGQLPPPAPKKQS